MFIKPKSRIKALGEVFTPPELVTKMLNKLPEDCWLPEKTFFEPACGDGNFCVEVLQNKLKAGASPQQALSTIYAIDIMQDNVDECRKRMTGIAVSAGCDKETADSIVQRNIICGNTLQLDFSGEWPPKQKQT